MVGDHMGIPRTVVLFLLYGIVRHICARVTVFGFWLTVSRPAALNPPVNTHKTRCSGTLSRDSARAQRFCFLQGAVPVVGVSSHVRRSAEYAE
jgi:hypothetical protein